MPYILMEPGINNCLGLEDQAEMERDVRFGLTRARKSIPSKYLYDSRGAELFERISQTPEYYLTRTELSILDREAGTIMEPYSNGKAARISLVDLGSGSPKKAARLLDTLHPARMSAVRYVPMDICKSCLLEAAAKLPTIYGGIEVRPILADFTKHLDEIPQGRKLITFFGSTIGNFTAEETQRFLEKIGSQMGPDDRLLIGMDMLKPVEQLEAAYNDRQGVTRSFNLNLLARLNRDLGADFDPDDFEHLARFNPDEDRIEMHLRAKRTVSVSVRAISLKVDFREGETIRTELCRKFSRESIEETFAEAGFSISGWFMDRKGWFSLVEAHPGRDKMHSPQRR